MQNMGKKQLTFQNPYNIITKCVTWFENADAISPGKAVSYIHETVN